MSGDASTPAQDQNVESNDVSATPDVDAGTPIDPVVEEAPAMDTEIDPANRLQQLEQELNSLKQEHETVQAQYVRIAADFDNFRKRQVRDQDDLQIGRAHV